MDLAPHHATLRHLTRTDCDTALTACSSSQAG